MIEGIEVLNKTPIMEMNTYVEFTYNATILLFAIFIVITIVVCANCKATTISIFAIITFALFITSNILSGATTETGRYEYQCIISDEVLFVDMYEKYEVVSKDGELWTIRDKEVEDE